MRILYLNPCGQMGGAETSLVTLLASIRAAQPSWELTLVLGEAGPLAHHAKALGVDVHVVPFPQVLARAGDSGAHPAAAFWSLLHVFGGTARYTQRLGRVIRAINPHLIHTNGFKMHVIGSWARPASTPVIWHIHDYVNSRPLMSRILRSQARRCAGAIANSESVAADLRTVLRNRPVVCIYNAVDLEKFSPSGDVLDLDVLSGLPSAAPNTLRVGLVSTFARWKGHKVFLEALSRLPDTPPIRGYIIGGPIYQTSGSQWKFEELREEVRRLGLTTQIGFVGFVDQPAAAIRALDIIVHASTQPEPFGMVIVEAMACGKPVIASMTGGATEIVNDNKNGVGHLPGDSAELARQIYRLANSKRLRADLGAAGRSTVERIYNDKRLVRELTAFYQQNSNGQLDTSSKVGPCANGSLRRSEIAPGERLRVLHVTSGNIYGGVESMLVTVARFRDLCPAMESHFAVSFYSQLAKELTIAGAPVYMLGNVRLSRPWTVWRARRRLRQVLREGSFDIVICHMPWSLVVFGQAVRMAGRKLAFWAHGPHSERDWLARLARHTPPDLTVGNSHFTAAALQKFFPGIPSTVVYPPVAAAETKSDESRAAVRREMGVSDNTVVIIQVSRLEDWKGHHLHLQALAQLKSVSIAWACWIVGGPQRPHEAEYLHSLQRTVVDLGLKEHVNFLGQRSDVARLLAAADIFCQPNKGPEPFGIVFIEALYAGCPVVSTAIGGAKEIIDDSCGLLVSPENPEMLADSLRRLIECPVLRARLAETGRQRARQLCHPSTQLMNLWDQLRSIRDR